MTKIMKRVPFISIIMHVVQENPFIKRECIESHCFSSYAVNFNTAKWKDIKLI